MNTYLGNAYYNAISTEHANHLVAVGWVTCADAIVELRKDRDTDNFYLKIKPPSDPTAQVLTPFEVTARIFESPRSIFVNDDHGQHHVQVYSLKPGEDSANEPGIWVESIEK